MTSPNRMDERLRTLTCPITKEEFDKVVEEGEIRHKHWHTENGILECYLVPEIPNEPIEAKREDSWIVTCIPLKEVSWQRLKEGETWVSQLPRISTQIAVVREKVYYEEVKDDEPAE